MQFASITKSLALALLGFSTAALAVNIGKDAYLASIGQTSLQVNMTSVGIARWTGEWQGQNYTLEGNIQQVVAQLEKLHPGSTDFLNDPALMEKRLESRDTQNKNQTYCMPIPGHPYWLTGYWDDFNYGIHYLYWVGGVISVDGGPGHCINIACNNDFWHDGFSGIWLCNDNPYEIHPNARYLSSYAQDLADDCTSHQRPMYLSGGQEFDSDRYNVVSKWGCNGI